MTYRRSGGRSGFEIPESSDSERVIIDWVKNMRLGQSPAQAHESEPSELRMRDAARRATVSSQNGAEGWPARNVTTERAALQTVSAGNRPKSELWRRRPRYSR